MNSYLASKISSFFVAYLRNSSLLRAIFASNLNILDRNLLRPELIRGSLKKGKQCQLSYYLAADEFFEDDAACLRWARLAFDAALRNPTKSRKKKS
jgi:hypothetical protein